MCDVTRSVRHHAYVHHGEREVRSQMTPCLAKLALAFEDKKTFRVELSNLVGITIKNALSLLGIGVVNRM